MTGRRQLLSIGALAAAVLVAMALLSPSRPEPTLTPGPTQAALSPAEQYARTALKIMEEHAFHLDEVDWPTVVSGTMAQVRDARSPAETYPAITAAITAAGLQGSLLRPGELLPPEVADLPAVSIADGIGRVVPGNGPVSAKDASVWATAVADLLDVTRPTCGWIIDVRETQSSEDWGLLAGLHAFIPEGELFQLRDRNDKSRRVSMAMGSLFVDGPPMATVSHMGERITKPVAVLQSGDTSGMGEALVLALTWNDRVRTFGTTTGGALFAERFTLPDRAELVLPTARLTDLAGHDLTQGIPAGVGTDDAEGMAVQWLRTQCRHAVSPSQTPEILAVACSPDGLTLSGHEVAATAAGVRVRVSSTAPAGTYANFGWDNGAEGNPAPRRAEVWTLPTPPGNLRISCSPPTKQSPAQTVRVTDPEHHWRSTTLADLGCPPGVTPSWDIPGPGRGTTAEHAVTNLLASMNGTDWSRATASLAQVGYPQAPIQTWIVSRSGRAEITVHVTASGAGFEAYPDILCRT